MTQESPAQKAAPNSRAIAVSTIAARADNLAFAHQTGDVATVQAAFAQADRIMSAQFELPRLAPTTMELRGALARYDQAAGIYHLITHHQGINEIRADLAAVLRVAEAQIRIELPDVGGGFGARSPAYPEHAALLLAAKLTGRSVRWTASRSEAFSTDYYGCSARLKGCLALDQAGRFTALDMGYGTDLGAYITTVGAFVNVHNPLMTCGSTYGISAIALEFRQYFTHTGSIGPYRGAGRPDMALLVERLVDIATQTRGNELLVLRARNTIGPAAFPYRTALGITYDNADYPKLIATARQRSDWADFAQRRDEAQALGRLFGRGVALFTQIAGGGAVTRDEARVRLYVLNGPPRARIETVTGGGGQSQAETYAFILAPRIGLDPADIELVASPPDSTLHGAGSIASRSILSAGRAIADAGDQLRAQLLAPGGLRANAAPDDLSLANGAICRRDGTPVLSLAEAINAADAPLEAVGTMPLSTSFPSGCHIAEIEIDPQTGVATLARYVAIDDAGLVLNPVAAEGQIHGGIAQELGEVFGEAMITKKAPTLLPNNPLGVKGSAEAGTTGALAAATNTIADALAQAGATLPPLPCTAPRIWEALQRSYDGKKDWF